MCKEGLPGLAVPWSCVGGWEISWHDLGKIGFWQCPPGSGEARWHVGVVIKIVLMHGLSKGGALSNFGMCGLGAQHEGEEE